MKYREKFHMSITEFDQQPYWRVMLDLKMMQIEEEFKENTNGKHKRS